MENLGSNDITDFLKFNSNSHKSTTSRPPNKTEPKTLSKWNHQVVSKAKYVTSHFKFTKIFKIKCKSANIT